MKRSYRYYLPLLFFLTFSLGTYGQSGKQNIDSVRSLVQKLSHDTDKVNTLLVISRNMLCDDSAGKMAVALEAKRIAEKVNWANGIHSSNRVIGDIYFKCRKDYVAAFGHYQANVEYAKKNNDKANQALALETIARQYGEIHRYDSTIEYYTRELELKPGIALEAAIYGNMGIAYKSLGAYTWAIKYYDSALTLLKSKKKKDGQDSLELAGLYLNLGEISLVTSQPERALQHYQDVYKMGSRSNDEQVMIWALTGIGKTYKAKKDYKAAIDNYQQALAVCNQTNAFTDIVKIDVELANTFMETWDLKAAQGYADNALSLAETQHYINLLSKCNATVGNIYLKQDKYDLAISYLQKALDIAKQTNNLEDLKDAWESLDKAYAKAGQWQQAHYASENFHAIRDSLFNNEKSNLIVAAVVTREVESKKEMEAVKLQAANDRKFERQRVITYSGFAGLILVLALAFFVYRNYKTQKKYNELLSREKQRHLAHIEAQSNILSDISHIQAHQVRGPVSTILGLVHIYNYEDANDPMNKQVMEWITSTVEKLDDVVKEVIIRENELRGQHEEQPPMQS